MATNAGARRRVPASVMFGLWSAAFVWTSWWTWELWASPGVYAAGPGIVFALWFLPVVPLFIATPVWLRRRAGRGGFGLLVLLGAAAVLFFVVPFHLPREYFGPSGSHTEVPVSLYVFMAALTVLPIGTVLTSLARVVVVRRHIAGLSRPDA